MNAESSAGPSPCPILQPTDGNLDDCARLLRGDKVLALPTETVYGLAGNALSEHAARRIFEVKGRPLLDPLIVHFPGLDAAADHIEGNAAIQTLARAFWPGPLTLIATKRASIPDLVTAGRPGVAVRVPRHPVFRQVLARVDFPLAAPSANPFGYVSPTRPEHVQRILGHRIPAILDGGPCEHGLESTIIDLRDPQKPLLLRAGPINATAIEASLGAAVRRQTPDSAENAPAEAPGTLPRHYSPATPVRLLPHDVGTGTVDQLLREENGAAVILLRRPEDGKPPHNLFWLSNDGDLTAVASHLFDLLHRLDPRNHTTLYVQCAPAGGLGDAINDRLRRAAAKTPEP